MSADDWAGLTVGSTELHSVVPWVWMKVVLRAGSWVGKWAVSREMNLVAEMVAHWV